MWRAVDSSLLHDGKQERDMEPQVHVGPPADASAFQYACRLTAASGEISANCIGWQNQDAGSAGPERH
jgi:hypothetical protein